MRLHPFQGLALAIVILFCHRPAAGAERPEIHVLADSLGGEVQPEIGKRFDGTLLVDGEAARGLSSRRMLAYLQSRQSHPIHADALLLNCGLADLERSAATGEPAVSLAEYEQNLHRIVGEARKMELAVLWFSSTPDIEDIPKSPDSRRNPADVVVYNQVAQKVMDAEHVMVLDAYGFCRSLRAKPAPFPVRLDPKMRLREAEFFAEALGQWWAVCAAANPAVQRTKLWPGAPPEYQDPGAEFLNDRGRVSRVSVPEITRFFPKARCNGTAIIVFPGGGYGFLGFLRNARELAAELTPKGIAVFGLKYRTGRGAEVPLLDAQRAVRWVRLHAKEWGVDPNRIGVVGISAGANLALNLASRFTSGNSQGGDWVERQSSRPDFVAVFSSWNFGRTDSPFQFRSDTPPVFLRHAKDERCFPLAERIVVQLHDAGVPAEVLFLERGGHGAFDQSPDALGADWPKDLMAWLQRKNLLAADTQNAKTTPAENRSPVSAWPP